MGCGRQPFIFMLAAAAVLCCCGDAHAWGPATHVQLASDLLSGLWLLPAGAAAVIARHRRAFIYGNVATDTVFAKKMSRVKQICHHWRTGFGLLDTATSDEGRAFAYGYLAHLAADTVAHNKFIPRQVAVCKSTLSFGHLYWELRADSAVPPAHWQELRDVLRSDHAEAEGLLESHLQETLLSYQTNRFLFRRMNLLASERTWRRSVTFWGRLSRFRLRPEVLAGYHDESLDRIVDVFAHLRGSAVLHEDPNGNSALGFARTQRKQLRQMKRARMPHRHVIHGAARGHAPAAGRALEPVGPH